MDQQLVTTSVEAAINRAIAEAPIPGAVPPDTNEADYKAVHQAKLADIRQRASTLPPVTDEATLDKNQKALTALTKVRTGLNAYRKDMLAPFTDLKKKVDTYFGTDANSGLQALVADIEEPIRERINAYKNEQERLRQEAQRIIDKRNEDRAQHVLDRGMAFDGRGYKLGALVLWPADLRLMDEKAWTAWCNDYLEPAVAAVKAKAEQEAREREEDERRRKEEAERLEREKEALRKEKQAMREQWFHFRRDELHREHPHVVTQLDPVNRFVQVMTNLPDGDLGPCFENWSMDTIGGASNEEWEAIKAAMVAAAVKPTEVVHTTERTQANPPGLTEEEAMEQAVSTAMAASSGIEEHPDEKLVRETEELLDRKRADRKADNAAKLQAMAAELEKQRAIAQEYADTIEEHNVQAAFKVAAVTLRNLVLNLQGIVR